MSIQSNIFLLSSLSLLAGLRGVFLLLLLLSSCTKENRDLFNPGEGDEYISFTTPSAEPSNHTRAAGYTLQGVNSIRSMEIYAAYTSDVWDFSEPNNNYMDAQRVDRSSAHGTWYYEPERLWPSTGYISFFAIAPYNATGATVNSGTGYPTVGFTVQPSQSDQVDLLVSSPVLNQTKKSAASSVSIPLKHALTKIGFSARIEDAYDAGAKITKIELSALSSTGTYQTDGTNKTWSGLGNDQTFVLTTTNGLIDLPLTETYQHISEEDGYLFLLPQLLDESDMVTVTYTTVGGEEKIIELKIFDAISRFKPGDAYNLMIVIGKSGVPLVVAPVEWQSMTINADVQNRILNITRLEACVTDAAVTRIHFWSNQPSDALFVEESLMQGDLLIGTSRLVNSIYQNLSGVDAANITYNGFDNNSLNLTKGEGYIDVIHLDHAVMTNNSQQINHIFLNAGGLVRSIKLNSINSLLPDDLTTGYIGTFHRNNEVGERLIVLAAPDASIQWSAEVIAESAQDEYGNLHNDYTEVRLDRWPSPAMENGSIYTEGVIPAEEGQVEGHPGSPQKVSGIGNIYFRIGWASTNPYVRNRNRYAKVQVTVGETSDTLFIRQGEMADYVMRPTDASVGDFTSSARPCAIKWSPYNLSDPNKGGGGVDMSGHNQLNSRGGCFTDYPTQAGYFFQWASLDNPRRAYHPQSPVDIAINTGGYNSVGWRLEQAVGFWNTLSAQHELCPTGYRRPASGSISSAVMVSDHTNSEVKQSLYNKEVSGSRSSFPDDQVAMNVQDAYVGYYADGYFDRRMIENAIITYQDGVAIPDANSCVSRGSNAVAYRGVLFTNPISLASLFFPASGNRYHAINTGSNRSRLRNIGVRGSYWTSARPNNTGSPAYFEINYATGASVYSNNLGEGRSIRCVRDIPFNSNLNDWNEQFTPATLTYNSADNSGASIDNVHIATVVERMERDIFLLPPNKAYLITAKINFVGTTAVGEHSISLSSMNTYADRIKKGTLITFSFNDDTRLTYNGGSTYKISVPTGWEGVTTFDTSSPDWSSATQEGNDIAIIAKGTLVLRKK